MWLYLYVIIVNKFGYLNPVIKVVYTSTAMYFGILKTVIILAMLWRQNDMSV